MNVLFALRDSKAGEWAYRLVQAILPPVKISRTVWGLKVFFDLRDCLFYLAMSRKQLETLEGPVLEIMKRINGPVWDIGCNIGLFSLFCAAQGRDVVSFDISEKCIGLLEASAARNKLQIKTVPTALSIESFDFVAPRSAHTMNAVAHGSGGTAKTSMTIEEAVGRFGIPRLIKMDIEGAELEFFRSAEFKEWIQFNRIALLVEIHSAEIWEAVWKEMPHEIVDERHVFFTFDEMGEG